MAQLDISGDVNQIIAVVKNYPQGVLFDGIVSALGEHMSRRTLQRRLSLLVKQEVLTRKGWGQSVRYHIKSSESQGLAPRNLSLSTQASEVKHYVSQPVNLRKQVNYRHDFLDSYQPNTTYYLSPNDRKHLEQIGSQPDGNHPAGTFAKQIFNKLIIDLSWNSSRLEGNTYSLLETERLLFEGAKLSEKSFVETQMILNHKDAIEFLIESAREESFNRFTIFNLHALLSRNLLGNPAACGRIRNIPVGIGKTSYQPLNIPQQLEEKFNQILAKATQINDPYEQAFFAMAHIPYLQPFEDVNKRTSRLAANIPMIKNNLCPLSFIDVPKQDYIDAVLGVYELNDVALLREVFVWAYERSAARYSAIKREAGEPEAFRLQYQANIQAMVQDVVQRKLSKKLTTLFIRQWVEKNIDFTDQSHFIDVVEEELLALHEGNLASYKIKLTEFDVWQQVWESS